MAKKRKNGAPAHAAPQPVALYMRVSTDDQAAAGTIEAQRTYLGKWAELHLPGRPVFEYADDGVSGTTALEARPEGKRLLDDAQGGKFGVVVVYKVDRLSRSLPKLLAAHDALQRLGVRIMSGTEPIDTSTPIGNFIFQLLGSFAELDRASIMERTSRGRDRVAAGGRHVGGVIAAGYTLDDERRLTPDPQVVPEAGGLSWAELVRDLYERLDAGSTLYAERDRLNALGVPCGRRYGKGTGVVFKPNRGGWTVQHLHALFKNPLYKGEKVLASRYGDVTYEVPPLVGAALWERVQERLSANRSRAKGNETRTYLLRGLIRCGLCGAGYGGTFQHGKNRPPSYRCNRRGDGYCPSKFLPAEALEDFVWRQCRQFILDPDSTLAEAAEQLRERRGQVAGLDGERKRLEGELLVKETERDRAIGLCTAGTITPRDLQVQLGRIGAQTAELRALLDGLQGEAALLAAEEAHLADARLVLGALHGQLETVERDNDVAAKRRLIELLVKGIRVDTEPSAKGARKKAKLTVSFTFARGGVESSKTRVISWLSDGLTT